VVSSQRFSGLWPSTRLSCVKPTRRNKRSCAASVKSSAHRYGVVVSTREIGVSELGSSSTGVDGFFSITYTWDVPRVSAQSEKYAGGLRERLLAERDDALEKERLAAQHRLSEQVERYGLRA
jgi:hypothetical protein